MPFPELSGVNAHSISAEPVGGYYWWIFTAICGRVTAGTRPRRGVGGLAISTNISIKWRVLNWIVIARLNFSKRIVSTAWPTNTVVEDVQRRIWRKPAKGISAIPMLVNTHGFGLGGVHGGMMCCTRSRIPRSSSTTTIMPKQPLTLLRWQHEFRGVKTTLATISSG